MGGSDEIDLAVMASPQFAVDPYTFYARWQRRGSVHPVAGTDCLMILGYDDALAVLKDHANFSSSPNAAVSPSLNGAGPPQHTAVRKLLQPHFSPERQLARRERVREIVRKKLDELRGRPRFDAIADFSAPVAHSIACDWLGLDQAGAAAIRLRDVPSLTWADVESSVEDGGLIAKLAEAGSADQTTIAELTGFLLMAGVETAREFVLFSMLTLARNRQAASILSADPARIGDFVEEFLRLEPPAHTVYRRATRDMVVGGRIIPSGATVWVSIAAANRDPKRFPDPDTIIAGRVGARHLAFSAGPHFCLGSHLGRLESEVMLTELMPYMNRLLTGVEIPELRFVGTGGAPSLRQIVRWTLSLE